MFLHQYWHICRSSFASSSSTTSMVSDHFNNFQTSLPDPAVFSDLLYVSSCFSCSHQEVICDSSCWGSHCWWDPATLCGFESIGRYTLSSRDSWLLHALLLRLLVNVGTSCSNWWMVYNASPVFVFLFVWSLESDFCCWLLRRWWLIEPRRYLGLQVHKIGPCCFVWSFWALNGGFASLRWKPKTESATWYNPIHPSCLSKNHTNSYAMGTWYCFSSRPQLTPLVRLYPYLVQLPWTSSSSSSANGLQLPQPFLSSRCPPDFSGGSGSNHCWEGSQYLMAVGWYALMEWRRRLGCLAGKLTCDLICGKQGTWTHTFQKENGRMDSKSYAPNSPYSCFYMEIGQV